MAESDTVGQIRQKLFPDGDAGFMKVLKVFQKMVKKNSFTLNSEEFEQGLKNAGLSLEPEEVAAMFKKFDRDGSGDLNLNEFFIALRPPMSEYRKKVLMEVFQKADKTGDGVISIDDIKNDMKIAPRYYTGNVEDALKSFLHVFEPTDGRDAKITQEEFMHYYAGVSATAEEDQTFVSMLEVVWKVKVEVKKEED